MLHLAKFILSCWLLLLLWSSCRQQAREPDRPDLQTGTPVTVVSVTRRTLMETVELNATSSFQLKTAVKSMANGYLKDVKIKEGDYVSHGEVIMRVMTKEAQALGNTVNSLDTSFHFRGEINIVALGNGYISQLSVRSGDYVQDGDQVAIISDAKSFAFILELPYELTPLLRSNKNVQLVLPDGLKLNGTIEKPLPTVDAASQTQRYLISVKSTKMIPENLVAKVILVKSSRQNAMAIPKEALLTDETQSSFWVMKLLNDSTAVKTAVQKGIESDDQVEILFPAFSESDRILITGNYGLPDSARVYIVNPN